LEPHQNKADQIRREVIDVAVRNKQGHIAPSLSCVDILVALYYEVMGDHDELIFSKAHGCYGLYAILTDLGKIPREVWLNFELPGCSARNLNYGITAGCGSLGHGLPIAVGAAFGKKVLGHEGRVFCIVGDGEMQEGSNWEAIQFAVKHELNNLAIIVDDNRLQAMDFRINVMDRFNDSLRRRLSGFGLWPIICNGHDMAELIETLNMYVGDKFPHCVMAETIKGYGLLVAENVPKFHYRLPTQDELRL